MIKRTVILKKVLAIGCFIFFSLVLLQPLTSWAASGNLNIVDPVELRNQIQNSSDKAATFNPSIDIPGSNFLRGTNISAERAVSSTVSLLGQYIKSIYGFFVGIAAIIATFMIALGGFMWLVSGGGDNIKKAKEFIVGAIVGLVLILGSYVFLMIINPNLVRLDLAVPDVPKMALPSLGTDACSKEIGEETIFEQGGDIRCLANQSCPFSAGSGIKSSAKATFSGVEIMSVHPALYSQLIMAISNLNNGAGSLDGRKYDVVIKSARRSLDNQYALHDCYTRAVAANGVCPVDCSAGCATAAKPNCYSPHVEGVAVDLCIKRNNPTNDNDVPDLCTYSRSYIGTTDLQEKMLSDGKSDAWGQALDDLTNAMKDNGFSGLSNEWWHYQIPGLPEPAKLL